MLLWGLSNIDRGCSQTERVRPATMGLCCIWTWDVEVCILRPRRAAGGFFQDFFVIQWLSKQCHCCLISSHFFPSTHPIWLLSSGVFVRRSFFFSFFSLPESYDLLSLFIGLSADAGDNACKHAAGSHIYCTHVELQADSRERRVYRRYNTCMESIAVRLS